VGPTDRGWRRDPLCRGDGERFLVQIEKRGGYRGSAGEGFFSFDPLYGYFFGIGNEIGKLLKLLLAQVRNQRALLMRGYMVHKPPDVPPVVAPAPCGPVHPSRPAPLHPPSAA
jgi:hypothetical protein